MLAAVVHRRQRVALGRLLAAATASVGRDDGPPLRPLVAAAPQGALPGAADFHRIEGCLHEALRDVDGVDPDILAALQQTRERSMLQHLVSVRALGALTEIFGAADVPWLVMKGPALAHLLYRDPGLRRAIDLDVLVARQHFVPAVEALEAVGYRDLVANWPMVGRAGASELTLFDGRVSIDLHWHVLYSHYERRSSHLDAEELLERARTVSLGGRQVRTLDPVDTLLHLGIHTTRSGGDRLIWLKDIERSLTVEQPDADELVRRARRSNRAPMVGLALRRASSTLGFALPDGVIDSLIGRSTALVDRLVTAIDPPERADAGLSPSHYLSVATKSGPARTAADLAWVAVDRVRSTLARDDATGPDAEHASALTRPVGDHRDEQRYLDWVVSGAERPGASAFTVRRARRADDIVPILAAHEPRTTAALADVLAFGLRPWRCRAWIVERGDEPAGAVVVRRTSIDRWFATVLAIDSDASATVARTIDRSPAWSVTGSALDVTPVLPHLDRRRALTSMPWVVAPPPVAVTTRPDDGVRDATRHDLPALVELYRGYELASEATVWQMRGTLGRLLDHQRILVSEDEDGRLVGAVVVSGPTEHWIAVDGLTVLPEHRGKQRGWALVARCQRIANDLGIGATGSIAASNPMRFDDASLDDQWWMGVSLHAPVRFRGQGRLRRLYSRIGSRTGRDWEMFRDLQDPSRPPG